MNEKLEEAMNELFSEAYAAGWYARETHIHDNGDSHQTSIKNENQSKETKAAIRELFQAQIYAAANVGELITALRDAAFQHGKVDTWYDAGVSDFTELASARVEATAAEDALRKALGVQRD